MFRESSFETIVTNALGIGAASFWSEVEGGAEKDIAETPTAEPERHDKVYS